MYRLPKWIILFVTLFVSAALLFFSGCNGARVTVTIPPATITAPPVTITATISTAIPGETTETQVGPLGLKPAEIVLSVLDNNNRVRTLHTMVATVVSDNGTPLPGIALEWIILQVTDSVGEIVAIQGGTPQKNDNYWAVARTDSKGQVKLVVTSVNQGSTYIMAYVPGITNQEKQKVYTVKNWVAN
jgi:hypothetical protein